MTSPLAVLVCPFKFEQGRKVNTVHKREIKVEGADRNTL